MKQKSSKAIKGVMDNEAQLGKESEEHNQDEKTLNVKGLYSVVNASRIFIENDKSRRIEKIIIELIGQITIDITETAAAASKKKRIDVASHNFSANTNPQFPRSFGKLLQISFHTFIINTRHLFRGTGP